MRFSHLLLNGDKYLDLFQLVQIDFFVLVISFIIKPVLSLGQELGELVLILTYVP